MRSQPLLRGQRLRLLIANPILFVDRANSLCSNKLEEHVSIITVTENAKSRSAISDTCADYVKDLTPLLNVQTTGRAEIQTLSLPIMQEVNNPNKPSPLLKAQENHPNSRSPIVTPVNVPVFNNLIQGFEYDEYLISGFTNGFELGYKGPRRSRMSPNLPNALELPEVITKNLEHEVHLGRICGPFDSVPFVNLQVSPIGCVAKKAPGEYRMIHHLSYPKKDSINDYICAELATCSYSSFDDAAQLLVKLGQHSLMAKTDIETAFRIIPIYVADHELLGIFWDGHFYYDTCLPFGASSSCAIFERFSSGLQWIAQNKFGLKNMLHILDDFLFLGPANSEVCLTDLNIFLALCKHIGVPIKTSKTEMPTSIITFMGLTLDSDLMEARLPPDKLSKLRDLLQFHSKRRKITLLELQSLVGFLNFCCSVVRPGRAFLRRLINLTIGLSVPSHRITLNKEARRGMGSLHHLMVVVCF